MTKGQKPPSSPPPVAEGAQSKPRLELRYTPDAATDIRGLDGGIRNQLRKVLEKKLAVEPEGYGLPLRGSRSVCSGEFTSPHGGVKPPLHQAGPPVANYWKHEFGSHRIIYRVYPQHHVVVVCAVGVRKQGDAEDIYRQLESVAKTGRLAEQLASVLKHLLAKG